MTDKLHCPQMHSHTKGKECEAITGKQICRAHDRMSEGPTGKGLMMAKVENDQLTCRDVQMH